MGNFYTNFIIVGGKLADVLETAKELNRKAYVIRDKTGDVLLFDADCDEQDVTEIERLGRDLTNRLQLPVIGSLNHDDDHLLLWLFRADTVTRYESCANAFAFGWAMSKVRGGIATYPFIVAVLAWPIFIFQVFRHQLLAWITALPPICAGIGYTYLSRGERPAGISEDDIKRA